MTLASRTSQNNREDSSEQSTIMQSDQYLGRGLFMKVEGTIWGALCSSLTSLSIMFFSFCILPVFM